MLKGLHARYMFLIRQPLQFHNPASVCCDGVVQALTVVALLCGGDYDGGGGAGMVGPRQAFAIVRKLIADARKVCVC